ncbi:MAG: hypothetical protein BA861_06955 [Desulfobacterales bacterium S3730MH5]|nr:MAG: hypothetical protein BA861_06955 [Desulfobacterales bacterium S3730MH5]OEU78600.1 MAG: hypothetical protein BA873_10990 [Desulfobulbaceae bacterium C00003063]OEU81065.1 MAG: hypothetical protein BA865_04865 [Desulfobacterales bacterium S5133MH4]
MPLCGVPINRDAIGDAKNIADRLQVNVDYCLSYENIMVRFWAVTTKTGKGRSNFTDVSWAWSG